MGYINIAVTWWWKKSSHGKSQFLIGKPSINGPFSMAMLNNQMVYLFKIKKHYIIVTHIL
jgi:hypothetical protein